MTQETYAKYFKAYPKDKRSVAQLTSSNSLCGDRFKLEINSKNSIVRIKNKFGYSVADLSEENSKLVKL